MVNILLEGYDIKSAWIYDGLKPYLRSGMRVVVLPFAYRDHHVFDEKSWEIYYGDGSSQYNGIVGGFKPYGIKACDISFVNYFTDTRETASEKIKHADIIYFPGGLADKITERAEKLGILDLLLRFDGVVMGYSAGALVQLGEYHLSPDKDYPSFRYERGLSYIDGFYLEVHYTGSAEQDESIKRVVCERGKRVYATSLMSGAVVCDGGRVTLLGDVREFSL